MKCHLSAAARRQLPQLNGNLSILMQTAGEKMFLDSPGSALVNILPHSQRGLFHGELARKNVSPRVSLCSARGEGSTLIQINDVCTLVINADRRS